MTATTAATTELRLERPVPTQEPDLQGPASGVLLALALGIAPAVPLAFAVSQGGISNPWVIPLALLTFCISAVIVLMDLRYGLAMFIVAAGISPKMPGIYNNLRLEDFIFVMVFGLWVLKALQAGRLPQARSPIVAPFLFITLMSLLSTIWGFSIGTIPDWKYSIFIQAKRVEYFLIFWVVASTVRTEAWLRVLTILFVISGALAALYGLANPVSSSGQSVAETRVAGPEGDNYNTLSGYLVVCIGVGIAGIPSFRRSLPRLLLIGCTGLAALALLFSFSREGYIMLMGSLLVFGFTRHRLILLGALVALAGALVLSGPVRNNVTVTVDHIREAPEADPGGNSLSARYSAWRYRWHGWFLKHPWIGNGVGAVALTVDNEYLLRACETGVIGFALFGWWLAAIGAQIQRLRRVPGLAGMLAVGLLAAFVGLLIQGMAAASFTTIRTMEPFWFLLGLVAAAAAIHRRKVREAEWLAGEPA